FVSIAALGWFGWKLLDQERIVEAQRAQERLEQSADRIAATLRGSLAETGESVGAWGGSAPVGVPDGSLVLRLAEASFTAYPAGRLLYYPVSKHEPEAHTAVFIEAEALEFQQRQLDSAAHAYERLAESNDAPIRAGALLRLARVLRKSGRREAALAAYSRLTSIRNAAVADLPADLVARP